MMKEHGVNSYGEIINEHKGYVEAMFSEDNDGKYSPRALFCDLDPTTIDALIQSDLENIITCQHIIAGKENASSNFARGHYTTGKEIISEILDKFKALADECENLKTFAIFCSVAGGTGGGLSTLVLERLNIAYPKLNKI